MVKASLHNIFDHSLVIENRDNRLSYDKTLSHRLSNDSRQSVLFYEILLFNNILQQATISLAILSKPFIPIFGYPFIHRIAYDGHKWEI